MAMRGSSTALDAVLFVLLVGAAVGTLAGVDAGGASDETHVATETADVLATSTSELTYVQTMTVADEGGLGIDSTRTVRVERTARGTYAELLANAVVANPSVDGVALAGADHGLKRATRNATEYALPTRTANVQVRTVWRPYEGAPPGDRLVVGDSPPADEDVSVSTVTVPSGFPNVTRKAVRRARTDGYSGVATVVARGIIDGLYPPEQTRAALHSDGPELGIVAARYRRVADELDVAVEDRLEQRDVHGVNEKLSEALADPIRDDLVREFDSADGAARAIRIDRVRIVVRTWSP